MKIGSKISVGVVVLIAAWLLVLIGIFLLSGCKTLKQQREYKRYEQVAVKKWDSLMTRAAELYKTEDSAAGYRVREWSEETEGVPGSRATMVLEAVDLQPVTDADGNKSGRTFTAKSGGTTATVEVDKEGRAKIDCKTDSLLRVVRKYRMDSAFAVRQRDSMANILENSSRHEVTDSSSHMTLEEVARKENGGFLRGLKAFLIGVLIGYAVRWYQKR